VGRGNQVLELIRMRGQRQRRNVPLDRHAAGGSIHPERLQFVAADGFLSDRHGTVVVFRVGAQDAGVLGRKLAPVFSEEDLIDLPYYHAYIRMMIDGKPAKPFSARVLDVGSLSRPPQG
jgi:hypothetical protein